MSEFIRQVDLPEHCDRCSVAVKEESAKMKCPAAELRLAAAALERKVQALVAADKVPKTVKKPVDLILPATLEIASLHRVNSG